MPPQVATPDAGAALVCKEWLALVAGPLALLFAVISGTRRYAYRHDWRKGYRSSLPVIVVGNISVGGNGKTPVVVWLVEQLQARGYRPGW